MQQIRPKLLESENLASMLSEAGAAGDSNKGLSNLAFLDLSVDEKESLSARYKALNQHVNEADATSSLLEPSTADIIS